MFLNVARRLALAALLLASLPPARPQTTEWYGRAVAQSTLEGIGNVRVVAEPVPDGGLFGDISATPVSATRLASVRTEVNGSFAISAASPARLRLSAQGFLDGFVLLHDGRDNDLGRLVLRHELSFSGRLQVDGEPAAGVVVIAPARSTLTPLTTHAETISDAAGRFRIGGIRPEQFSELVFVREGIAEPVALGSGLPPIDARQYDLGNFELLSHHTLSVRVVDTKGSAVADATLRMSSSSSRRLPDGWSANDIGHRPSPTATTTSASGVFELRVGAGTQTVFAFSPTEGSATASVDIGSPTAVDRSITIELPGTAPLGGRIVDQRGGALAGVRVQRRMTDPELQEQAQRDGLLGAETDDRGCYALRGLPLGQTIYIEARLAGFVPRAERLVIPGETTGAPSLNCLDFPALELEPAGHIEGTILDQFSVPVADASVYAQRYQARRQYSAPGRAPITTDQNGSFIIEGLLTGDYSLTAQAPGFVGSSVEDIAIGPLDAINAVASTPGNDAPPGAYSYTADLVMQRLDELTRLEVVTFDPRGAPEPEARVQIERHVADASGYTPPEPPGFTGADGRVVFPGAPQGSYTAWARARGSQNSGPRRGAPPIEAGDLPIIVTMRDTPPLASLSGRLIDQRGDGIRRAIIEADGATRQAHTISEADGSFRFDALPVGNYLLKVRADDLPPFIDPNLLEVRPGGLAGTEVKVPLMGSISGTVTGLPSNELRGLHVSASQVLEAAPRVQQSTSVGAQVDPDGSFRIDRLMPGNWTILARTTGGSRASTEATIDEAGSPSEATVAFPAGSKLTGTVTWRGEPPERARLSVAGKTVEFAPLEGFEVDGIPPGRHRIGLSGTGLRSPFFAYVRAEANAHVDIVVEGGAVSGRVIDADSGEPIAGVRIASDPIPQMVWDGHESFRRSDRTGRFTAGPFAAGPWQFEFSAPGYSPREPVIDIGAHDIGEYTVALRRTPGLALRLDTARGPVPTGAHATWYDFATGETYALQTLVKGRQPEEFNWPNAPLGRGVLSVTTSRPSLGARLEVDNQGQVVDVVLSATGGLYVEVEEFDHDPPFYSWLQIYDAEGRLVPSGFGADIYVQRRREPGFLVSALAPGTYRAVVTSTDGRIWSGTAEIQPFEDTKIVLR